MDTFTARIRTHYTADAVSLVNQGKATPLCRNKPMGGRKNMTAAPVDCDRCIKRAGTTGDTAVRHEHDAGVALSAPTTPPTTPPTTLPVWQPPVTPALAPIKARIAATYRDLPKGGDGYVGLADIRERLLDVDRESLDKALKEISYDPGARVTPVANRKSLTPRDHAAAVRIGLDENHMVSIEPSLVERLAPASEPQGPTA